VEVEAEEAEEGGGIASGMLRYLCRFCEFTVLRYVCSVSNSTSHNSDSCMELCFLSLQLVALAVAWCCVQLRRLAATCTAARASQTQAIGQRRPWVIFISKAK
jgi:hypothetical protein